MRRWELGVVIVIALVAIGGGWWWLRPQASTQTPASSTQVSHPQPLFAANGAPLPTAAPFDVVLTLTEGDQDFQLAYDWETGHWSLSFWSLGSQQEIRYLDQRFYQANRLIGGWDEVAPELLSDSIRTLNTTRDYLLDDVHLRSFRSVARAQPDEQCAQDYCAVWLASDIWESKYTIIRVNKRQRLIYDVTILDFTDQHLIATYSYQPVNIELPSDVRYLT